jgi:hypothetical protein
MKLLQSVLKLHVHNSKCSAHMRMWKLPNVVLMKDIHNVTQRLPVIMNVLKTSENPNMINQVTIFIQFILLVQFIS